MGSPWHTDSDLCRPRTRVTSKPPTLLCQQNTAKISRLPRGTEVAVYSSTGKTGDPGAWTSWHFAGGQDPTWYNSLETHLQLSAFLLGRSYLVRWGTLYLFCLAVPRNTFSKKRQATWQGAALLRGCETALTLKRKKVMYPLINWALQHEACKEALAASPRAVFRGGAAGSKLCSNKSEWSESKVTGRKTSKKREKKGSSCSVRSFIVAFSSMTSAIHPRNA